MTDAARDLAGPWWRCRSCRALVASIDEHFARTQHLAYDNLRMVTP